MSAAEDLVRRTLSETIALHERVKQANLHPVLDAAAVHAICDLVERGLFA
jgi:hypothetical protein